jgi:molybdopterin-containing oxidoreductase family iron-sulfur binding subunit
VRIFNYYAPHFDAPLEQQFNPDVTVRGPGVMEKCTFCIQRIRRTEESAKVEGRPVADGEVTPACVQACPSNALVFGDKYDDESRVAKLIPDQRQFKLLENLGTEPAVYYLKGGETHVGE